MATRKQIRDAIVTRISPIYTTAFNYRPGAIRQDEIGSKGCVSVYFDDGESNRDYAGVDIDTDATLVIEIVLSAGESPDDELDAKATLTENEIKQDDTLGGLVDAIYRTGFDYNRDSDTPNNTLTLEFTVKYDDED